ncbi:MAG: hypothetical protein GY704_10315 [Phycisphaeraceae bacterium]|nr:hypothetical protein [Phycisphaeraceae bacterium]
MAAFEDDIEHVVEFPEVAERWLTAADEAERISRRIARALRAAMAGADLLPDGYGSVPAVTNCAECGEPFEPKRADAQFCGSACRQRAYRQRQRST